MLKIFCSCFLLPEHAIVRKHFKGIFSRKLKEVGLKVGTQLGAWGHEEVSGKNRKKGTGDTATKGTVVENTWTLKSLDFRILSYVILDKVFNLSGLIIYSLK